MSKLAWMTIGLATAMGVLHAGLAFLPTRARERLRAFPRSCWPGRIMSALALGWAGWLLYGMPLGPLDPYKPWLAVLTPVTIGLTWFYLDELLSVRALGGLLLLIPAPILAAARLHPARLRVVVSAVCYVMIFKGLAFMLSPYVFRMWSARFLATDRACRIAGHAGLVLDLALVVLALTVYR
jgi:uncharacterized protein YjeT (DUF2065 family)